MKKTQVKDKKMDFYQSGFKWDYQWKILIILGPVSFYVKRNLYIFIFTKFNKIYLKY